MRCYFLRAGRLAGVEVLPAGLSDEEAIAKAHALSSKRKGGPYDSFEVWEGSASYSGDLCPLRREAPISPRRGRPTRR